MDPLLWIVLVIILLVSNHFWNHVRERRYAASNGYKFPPTPMGIPLIGHPTALANLPRTVKIMCARYGGTFRLHLAGIEVTFINSYEEMKDALINQADNFNYKALARSRFLRKIHLTSFNFISGPIWKEKRNFTIQHLRNFGFGKSVMENIVMDEFIRLRETLDKQVGQKVAINYVFFLPILNILWHIIAGKAYDYEDEKFKRLSENLNNLFGSGVKATVVTAMPFLQHLPGDPFLYWKFVKGSQAVMDFAEETIDEHLETLPVHGEPRDYIDAYLMEINKYTGKELKDGNKCYQKKHLVGGIVDLVQGGTHTTTTALRFALLYVASWPEIQSKIQEELDTVIGKNRLPAYSDKELLPYARATMEEVYRFGSVAPFGSFRNVKETTTVGEYTVLKGSLILLNLYAVNHDKKYWGDPETFRPERFLDANGKYKSSDHVVAFSMGPRICLGESLARMEIFMLWISLLQRYTFNYATGEIPPTMKAVNGIARTPTPFELVIKLR